MFPLAYGGIYKTPEKHQPPTDLVGNTEYPNLNSSDYAKRPLNHTTRMHESWECISLNDEKHAIVATNKLSGREWTGSIWGFEHSDVDDGAAGEKWTPANANFKLQCTALISQLQYVSRNIFLVALHSGKLQAWSTRSEVRNVKNPYCLFLIGEKCEHAKPIMSMDVMKANANKAITGSKDGTLKLWDMAGADLFSVHTFRFAHTDVITGVASSYKDDSVFATCSLDKSALLWDDRLTRPATALYENHNVRFKHLSWAPITQSAEENVIYLGDESGFLHSIDKRLPNEFIQTAQYLDKPIRKILPNGEYLAVIGDTNVVKVCKAKDHKMVYENAETQNFVRDGVWRDADEFLTVGYESKLRSHKIV